MSVEDDLLSNYECIGNILESSAAAILGEHFAALYV
jgi:hypothetical protein